MLANPQPPRLHLPKGWQDCVKLAVLHAIALAHYAIIYARAWAADSINARVRLAAENDRLHEVCALLREELRIKDTRIAQIAPQRRPHYGPYERMAILELRAARGWSLKQTADTFFLASATVTSWMNRNTPPNSDPLQPVLDYHQATKHRIEAYAPGPGFLDWETQPNPFRRYTGARLIPLDIIPPTEEPRYDAIFTPGQIPSCAPLTAQSIAQLFYDSLALSAWKSTGESRWALRVNASSGNLHPTEGYLICGPVEGLCDRPLACHYAPEAHALEVLAEFDEALWDAIRGDFPCHTVFLGLSTIHWREAWKYGKRAYRYCMHDAGHAIGALSIAAAGLGWRTRLLDALGTEDLALLMGTFRPHEAEREEADVLLACAPMHEALPPADGLPEAAVARFASLDWQGSPNRLSPSHLDWGIEELAACVRKPRAALQYEALQPPPEA